MIYERAKGIHGDLSFGTERDVDPAQLTPHMLRKRISTTEQLSYAELYDWLEPGRLLQEPPPDWSAADADTFRPLVR
ncbi:hypothetical protein [Nocardia sp. IFM 10818]